MTLHRLVQGETLESIKKRERPAFTTPKDNSPANSAYIMTRRSKRSRRWAGYLAREGFRWSRGRQVWVYDQHDDGSFITKEEAEWVADHVREIIAGDLSLTIGTGLFVEPIPDAPPVHRPYLRARRR